MQDKEFQALKDALIQNNSSHFLKEKSRAILVQMSGFTLTLYGEKDQLIQISKSILAYSSQVLIESKGSWGTCLRAPSIAIPMSLLLASNYQYLRDIHFHHEGPTLLPLQIWTKQA